MIGLLLALVQAPSSAFIEELTWPEVRAAIGAGKTDALVYSGSTEQNGPHMVLGKHNFIARYVAGAVAGKLGTALVYPIIPFAPTGELEPKSGHMRFPGSVTLTDAAYGSVVRGVAESAIAAGFTRVFLLGDHGGGQSELKKVASELDERFHAHGARVFYVPDAYYRAGDEAKAELARRKIPAGSHAGPEDTSELMAIDSAHRWIRAGKLAPSDSAMEPKTGVNGDPSRSSAEIGRVLLDLKIDATVRQIHRLRESGRP
jgi:creatinine amidohydrolase/Fe(II)-dependent formamide hydrolase-like protein